MIARTPLRLINYNGKIYAELWQDYVVFVEELQKFLELSAEEKSRVIKIAVLWNEPTDTVVH